MEPRIRQKTYNQFKRLLRYSTDDKVIEVAFDLWFQSCKTQLEVFWCVLFEISLKYKKCKYLKVAIENGALKLLFHDDKITWWKYERLANNFLAKN